MRTLPRGPFLFVLLLSALLRGQELALTGLDPVALAAGEERAGSEDRTLTHGRFRYRFASDANLTAFRTDPERHEIQFGGACARMGPLSGGGDPARWLVHDGRIFVFASDDCRKGFQQRPARFLDADTSAPPGDAAGRALLQRAIAAHGGEGRLRAWRTLSYEHDRTDGSTREIWRLQVAFPDRCRREHDYVQGERIWRYADVVAGDTAFQLTQGTVTPMHASARREAERRLLLDPVVALRLALARPHVATAKGKAPVDDGEVEVCELWLDGASLTLGLDAQDRVRTLGCRARGPQLWFGALELSFVGYEAHDGILLPHRVLARFDGKPAPELDERREHLAVDAALPEPSFQAPK